jgi:hypothetical protein
MDGLLGLLGMGATTTNLTRGIVSTNSSNNIASSTNSGVAGQPSTRALIGSLGHLSSDPRIRITIEGAIQALRTGDANKALFDLNGAHNVITQTTANSNSTLR